MNSYSLCKHSFWLYDWIKCFSENFFFLNHPLLESNSSASIYNQTSFSHCLVSMVFVVGALNKNLLKPLDPIKADLVGMVLVFSTLYQTDPLSWDDTWVVAFQLCILTLHLRLRKRVTINRSIFDYYCFVSYLKLKLELYDYVDHHIFQVFAWNFSFNVYWFCK